MNRTQRNLSYYIEDYLHTNKYQRYHDFEGRKHICRNTKYRAWYKSRYDIGVVLSFTCMELTPNFYKLVKD
ncbi:Plasmodium exported protein (PHISTa-like), unknown function [Plasmodium reichenowi]|uniref:Uncharacterized protein n=1 Tax=Plasmodium reichenowi TaxID=5854 RepID=A0A2P9DBE1_PLARE|nr:Plasmodium exported protein (PHISTa-like), unknown function [Plasmodium reichenowi]